MEQYENKKAIGMLPLSNFGGIEVLDIIYGIDDYVIACMNYGNGRQHIRKHKLYTTAKGRTYFLKLGNRCYMDEILRV